MNQPATGAVALTFHKTTFSVIEHTDGQIWLRGPQIADALGFANSRHLNELYKSNAAEFTDSMTALVKMPSSGGPQDTRIFSLRGAHLLGMLSRTDRAAEFRRWALDVLEQQGRPQPSQTVEALTAKLQTSEARCQAIRDALLEKYPEYRQVMKYHAIDGLNQVEKARLMGWASANSWRHALTKLSELGLLDYKPDPRAGARLLLARAGQQRAAKPEGGAA